MMPTDLCGRNRPRHCRRKYEPNAPARLPAPRRPTWKRTCPRTQAHLFALRACRIASRSLSRAFILTATALPPSPRVADRSITVGQAGARPSAMERRS
jgi:hypothetical protein